MFKFSPLIFTAILTAALPTCIFAINKELPNNSSKEMSITDKENSHKMMLFNQAFREGAKGDLHENGTEDVKKKQVAPLLHELSQPKCPVINKTSDIYDLVKNAKKDTMVQGLYSFNFNSKTYKIHGEMRAMILNLPTDTKVEFESEFPWSTSIQCHYILSHYNSRSYSFTLYYVPPVQEKPAPATVK
jgi:hypothetical protein